jgi:hypothetical protein
MSGPEIYFALLVIAIAFAAAIFMPVSRGADLWTIDIFAMVIGAVVASMGFLAFTTRWSESGAWESGVLIAVGGLIVCYMMNRCARHDRSLG